MNIEPILSTPSELQPVLEELRRREPVLHRAEFPDHAAQLALDFWEVGASGNRYSRNYVLETISRHQSDADVLGWQSEDHHCRQLSDDTYLLTYTLHQGERLTRRATIWRKAAQGWQALFHQGTIAPKS